MQHTLKQLVATEGASAAIDRIDAELSEFPAEQERVADGVRMAEAAVADAQAALEQVELEERRLESAMRDQEERILKLTRQSAEVASNQAYTALQNELESAENAKAEFETRALEHMESIDAAKETLAEVEQACRAVKVAAPDQVAEIDSRRKAAEVERETQVEKRAHESEGIDAKLMKRFEAIRAKKQPAIAIIEGKACPECKIVLPRIRLTEIMSLEEIYDCTSCKRILAPAKAFEAAPSS